MKTISILQPKTILCALSAVAILGTASCTYTERQQYDDYSNRAPRSNTVDRQGYVYYPAHNVYYNSRANHFRAYENDRWVTLDTPRNVSRQQVLSTSSVPIAQYGTPERHYTEYVQPNLRSGSQTRVTTSAPVQARTTTSRTSTSRSIQY